MINILWTGGFDSSFRMAQLSTRPVEVQPYYVADHRESEQRELEAMKSIMALFEARPATRFKVMQLKVIASEHVARDDIVTDAYREVLKTDFFGVQYDWLARLSLSVENLELCIHKDDKAMHVIERHGRIKRYADGDCFVIDRENSDRNINLLFGRYHLPLIEYTKLDMKALFSEWDMQDIADKTWFCYHPIAGRPCGVCNPCRYSIEEGMTHRFTRGALLRYEEFMRRKTGFPGDKT